MVKNPSTRPSQNYYLGPLSESVHEMDGMSPKSWSVVHMDRWTDGRSVDGRLRPGRPGVNGADNLNDLHADEVADLRKFLNDEQRKNKFFNAKINFSLHLSYTLQFCNKMI